MEQSVHRELWRRFEDEQDDATLIHDECGGVCLITEDRGAAEPHDIIAPAIAGAEAAEEALAGPNDEWALYAPQQTASAASALFAQITAAEAALENLEAQLDVMAERGDIVTPDVDGTGEAKEVADAQGALAAAGQDIYGAVTGRDTRAVSLLAAAQQLVTLPATAHETVAAVAALLGDNAKLHTCCHVEGPAAGPDLDCGCRIELADGGGVMWGFQREDGAWCLVRQADGHGVEPAATGPCADPRHVAALIRQAVQTAL